MNCLMAAWNTHEPELKGWLMQRASTPEQAEDWLQDVFLKALAHKERFCTLDDARSWLFRITRNVTIDSHRKQTPESLDELTPSHWLELEFKLSESDPDVTLLELQTCLMRVLSELPHDERDVIEACDIHRLRQQDYANQHGLTLTATKSRLLRARKALRQNMINACQIRFDNNQVCCFTPRP